MVELLKDRSAVKTFNMILAEMGDFTFSGKIRKEARAIMTELSKISGDEDAIQEPIEKFVMSFGKRNNNRDFVRGIYTLALYGQKKEPVVDELVYRSFLANLLSYTYMRIVDMAYNRKLIPVPGSLSRWRFKKRGVRRAFNLDEIKNFRHAGFGERDEAVTLHLMLDEGYRGLFFAGALEKNALKSFKTLGKAIPDKVTIKKFLNAMEKGKKFPAKDGHVWDFVRIIFAINQFEKEKVHPGVFKEFMTEAMFRIVQRVLHICTKDLKLITPAPHVFEMRNIRRGIEGLWDVDDIGSKEKKVSKVVKTFGLHKLLPKKPARA